MKAADVLTSQRAETSLNKLIINNVYASLPQIISWDTICTCFFCLHSLVSSLSSSPFLLSLVPFIHELESVRKKLIKTTQYLHRLRCTDGFYWTLSFNTSGKSQDTAPLLCSECQRKKHQQCFYSII